MCVYNKHVVGSGEAKWGRCKRPPVASYSNNSNNSNDSNSNSNDNSNDNSKNEPNGVGPFSSFEQT